VDYNFFLSPFFVSFAMSAVLGVALILLGKKKKQDDLRTSERHIHSQSVSRFGGVALIISFIITLFLDKRLVMTVPLMGVLAASGAILVFGVIDDIKQLSWKAQLFFQILIVSFVYFLGVRLQYITNPFGGVFLLHDFFGNIVGLAIVIIWVVLLIN
jgi:UDP-GlcNAc:undecaprenyl-phosphate/decaprenyl-phosphate GlcNAc-1-phosphate transferase